jgi:hypothetical protein
MKKVNEYEIGDLVIMLVDKYNTIGIGSVGIVKSQWGVLVNCAFGNTSGAFISEEIKRLEGSCK